jgi:hypothetical protein
MAEKAPTELMERLRNQETVVLDEPTVVVIETIRGANCPRTLGQVPH